MSGNADALRALRRKAPSARVVYLQVRTLCRSRLPHPIQSFNETIGNRDKLIQQYLEPIYFSTIFKENFASSRFRCHRSDPLTRFAFCGLRFIPKTAKSRPPQTIKHHSKKQKCHFFFNSSRTLTRYVSFWWFVRTQVSFVVSLWLITTSTNACNERTRGVLL